MTLSTLQSMNVPLADLSEALKIKMPGFAASAPAPAPPAEPKPEPEAVAARRRLGALKAVPAQAATATPAVDPMQWWGALTQQFTELATKAVKDSAFDSTKTLAGAIVKSSLNTAAGALKKAASLPVKAASRKRPAPKRSGR